MKFALLLAAVGLCLAAVAGVKDPVFPDVPALASTPLKAKVLKSTEKDGIILEEVMYHAEMDGEKSVDIWGLFGYPKGAKRLPAFVWNQSSAAPASDYFVLLGAQRGYAVLCIDLPLAGYRSTGGYPLNGLEVGDDPRHATIAHCAVALLKAVTYLASRPEVDKDRIGMAGASWGGFFTTLMTGIDTRLKAASCFFGTGNLQLGCFWFDGPADAAYAKRWRTTLDPGWRLARVKTPINWCTGTNDNYYWMPGLMKSYAMAGGPKHLALIANWDHGLPPQLDDEVLGFLDVYLQGKPAFPRLTPLAVRRQGKALAARWSFTVPKERRIVSADLMLSYSAPGNWRSRHWITLPVRMTGTACTAALPASSLPYFISGSVVEENGYRHSTPLLQVNPRKYGLKVSPPVADSFAEWGGFEADMPAFMYAYPKIQTSPDAHGGARALVLPPGRFALPPVYFIAGQSYRLSLYLKADQPASVTVQLAGRFDRIRRSEELKVEVGADWTPMTLDYPTEQAMMTDLKLTITTPGGRTVLLDDASFRPAP